MRRKTIRITIPEPCSENWEHMTLEGKGRHCAKCEKTVVDFTQMPDTKLAEYLINNIGTCGRYYNHQMDREIPVFKSDSFVLKYFRRSAFAGIFIAQLWPKKGIAQEIKNDSISSPSPLIQPVNNFAISILRTISGRVIQPDSNFNRAIKLKFSVDTFNIEIDISADNQFSFQLPQGFENDSVDIQLHTLDAVQQFSNVPVSQIGYADYFTLSQKELIFQFNNTWTYNIVYKPTYSEVTMGAYPFGIEQLKWKFDTSYLTKFLWRPDSNLITSGFSVLFDSSKQVKKDSGFKAAIKLQAKKDKKQSFPLWLLIIVTLPLVFLIRWFFNGLNNKGR